MCWRAVVCLLVEFALRTAFRFGTEPYGFGFRFNTHKSVFWRIDVGFGQEGTHMFVKFNHVF